MEEKNSTVASMAQESGAIIAITGDSGQNFSAGWNIGNGVVWRDMPNRKRDLGVLYDSGVLETIPAARLDLDALAAQKQRIWQTFLFGPVLLDGDGHALEAFNTTVAQANPHPAIGYFAPGHYCFVQADGRRVGDIVLVREVD